MVNEIKERAMQRCLDLSLALIDRMLGSDGETFGDGPIGRGDRILRFQDLSQSGALDILEVQSPKVYQKLLQQYIKDIRESPFEKKAASPPSTQSQLVPDQNATGY
jgi:hypothetical protein